MPNKIKQAAQEYIDLGWPIMPCNSKVPLLKGWRKRTETTVDDVNKWLKRWPNLTLGLPMGSASGIVGIDLDGPEAVKRFKELAGNDLQLTWAFKTPSGGKRYLFALPKGAPAKKFVQSLPGEHSEFAVLGDGQQTIVPPSTLEDGGKYLWFKGKSPDGIPLAPAPKWLLDLLAGQKPRAKTKTSNKTDKNISKAEHPVKDIFARLESRCRQFKDAHAEQQQSGISEDDWFLWCSVLTRAGHPQAAKAFSALSPKHNERSQKRLAELASNLENGKAPMPRCSTIGCEEAEVEQCHGQLNLNDDGEATNSPGRWIRDMTSVLPPSDPAYQPYLSALENNADYTIDQFGNLHGFDKKGNPVAVANFVARPTLEVIRDDGVTEERTFRIEALLAGAKPLNQVDISANDFTAMNWILKSWGIQASIRAGMGKKDMARDAIQNMASDVEQHRIYTHLGWRKLPSKEWSYLHSAGAIGAENISVEIQTELQRYCLPEVTPDAKDAAKASLSFLKLAPRNVTVPLLALTYLAPLIDSFKMAGMEPNFLLWLHGGTGTRKTSLALVLLCHFGQFAGKNPPASFKDTANALEMKAFATKDTLLLIDDYHPEASKYESQKMTQVAQRVLRMYGDRVGRGRLTSKIEFQRTYAPRGMALVTGEDIPQGQSTVARFLGLELMPNEVDLTRLTKHQANSHKLNQAMAQYINWLLPQMNVLPAKLAKEFIHYRDKLQQQAAHGRLGEAAAWLLVAFHMMIDFMVSQNAIESEKAVKIRLTAERILANLVQRQGTLVNQETPAEIFVKTLHELFSSGKVRVGALHQGFTYPNHYQLNTGEGIGWIDENYLYLLPELTYNTVYRSLHARGEIIPVKERTLWKHLDEANLLYTEHENGELRRIVKKTIPNKTGQQQGKRMRLLHLKRPEFQNLSDK